MKAADTSLVVAAFASWHESHEAARRALDSGLRLIEYCALETYSVPGGASCDALVAATAAGCGVELITCDRRALPIYERYGIRTHLIS